jgi:hypothetical protein
VTGVGNERGGGTVLKRAVFSVGRVKSKKKRRREEKCCEEMEVNYTIQSG